MSTVYGKVLKFKRRYPITVAWRLKLNSRVVEKHLNPDEEVIYAFAAQKNDNPLHIFGTAVVCLTNKRILIGRKRVIVGYFLNSVTPDLFNDLTVTGGIIWGKVHIDTVKELITLSNISNDALPEIESKVSDYMMKAKQKYKTKEEMEEENNNHQDSDEQNNE